MRRRQWTSGTLYRPAEQRIGRTAAWPASVGVTRFRGRVVGLIGRIGNRSVWFAVMPRGNRRA